MFWRGRFRYAALGKYDVPKPHRIDAACPKHIAKPVGGNLFSVSLTKLSKCEGKLKRLEVVIHLLCGGMFSCTCIS